MALTPEQQMEVLIDIGVTFGQNCSAVLDPEARSVFREALVMTVLAGFENDPDRTWDGDARDFLLGRVAEAGREAESIAVGVITAANIAQCANDVIGRWKKRCTDPNRPFSMTGEFCAAFEPFDRSARVTPARS